MLTRVLAAALPDTPEWVEVRGMLRTPGALVIGGDSVERGFVVRLVEGARSAVAVVGRPPREALAEAVAGRTVMTPVIAQVDNAGHVAACLSAVGGGWSGERAIVHRLAAPPRQAPLDPGVTVRLLDGMDPLGHLPAGLRHEMSHARTFTPVAGVFVGGVPVSFCYACWVTESLWDVSIDTLEGYRGRGLAPHAVRHLIDVKRRDALEPVWGALESNAASLRLAVKLGFSPVGAIVVFSRGPWAFLTEGFEHTG